MEKIKIILADDHQLFRDGLKSLLATEKRIEILQEFSNGIEVMEFLKNQEPDILITDISMPQISGIELSKLIKDNYPSIKVLILSMHINEEYIIEAIENGAKGYLPKDTSRSELINAIFEIFSGKDYFSNEVSNIVLRGLVTKKTKEEKITKEKSKLTKRELQIIKFVAEGNTNKEISVKLNISSRTVDNHKANIMNKLKLNSSIEIVKYAIKNEIIEI